MLAYGPILAVISSGVRPYSFECPHGHGGSDVRRIPSRDRGCSPYSLTASTALRGGQRFVADDLAALWLWANQTMSPGLVTSSSGQMGRWTFLYGIFL